MQDCLRCFLVGVGSSCFVIMVVAYAILWSVG
jgi:hypothetical protein